MTNIDTLIDRWRAGDERAAEGLYNHYRGITFGLAYTLLDDAADAEEVTQDALTYALTHISRYDPRRARFETWLHTITVSRCRNKRRRRLLPTRSLLGWLKGGGDLADPAPGPEHLAEKAGTRDEVWAAIQQLSQPLREAVVLRHWANFTYQEIAAILGCSMRTAQSRVRLAHKKLNQLLRRQELATFEETLE
jgi:RNA polymerase sigma-70 factor (ECF subfamily)